MIKYLGLILLLIGCNSTIKKDNVGSTEKSSPNISVDNILDQSLENEQIVKNRIDLFLVTENSVGIFKKGMTINEVIQMVPKRQIKKKVGYGEFEDDTYDDYEIYDKENQHILTMTPLTQNDSNSTINRVLIIDNRFRTESGISVESTYSELIKSYKVTDYSPDLEHIVLSVEQIGAWFSIEKTELEKGWWDEKTKRIDKTKIPSDSHFDSFVIWWN